jgi:hypothetical protein
VCPLANLAECKKLHTVFLFFNFNTVLRLAMWLIQLGLIGIEARLCITVSKVRIENKY